MIVLDTEFTDALRNGTGIPIFKMVLYFMQPDTSTELETYTVIECVLARMYAEVYVKENLLDGVITNDTAGLYAIRIVRGLTVNGTDYTIETGFYFVTDIDYTAEHGTHISVDLLPNASVPHVDGYMLAHYVIQEAFDIIGYPSDLVFDTTRDIWFDWQFYEAGKDLSLLDMRSMEYLLHQKYSAYIFQRNSGKLYFYGAASNRTNNEDGTYTPFSHAKIRYFLSPDRPANLAWKTDAGSKTYISAAVNDTLSLGYISDDSDPSANTLFQDWAKVFDGVMYEYTQRPDLRLEQGDLVKVSTDGFTSVRCFELIEVYKKGASPSWSQIVRQLPFHKIPSKPVKPWHPLPRYYTKMFTDPALEPVIQANSFWGALTPADSNVQNALDTLDQHTHAEGQGTPIVYGNVSGIPSDLRLAGMFVHATADSTTILTSFNVSQVIDSATGKMNVIVDDNFNSNYWCPIVTLGISNSGTHVVVPSAYTASLNSGQCPMESWDIDDGLTFVRRDPADWMMVGFGAI